MRFDPASSRFVHPMRSWMRAFVAVWLALLGCKRSHVPEPQRLPLPGQADEFGVAPALVPDASSSQCRLESVRWLVPLRDASTEGLVTIEGSALTQGTGGVWAAWIDRGTGTLVIAPPTGALLHEPLGAGETHAPVLTVTDAGATAAMVVQRGGTRFHRLITTRGGALREVLRQTEQLDDGLSIAAVSTRQGILVAWDEERPRGGSTIVVQYVPEAVLEGRAAGAPTRVVSPDEHDAVDPELFPTPDGAAVIAWLAVHPIDAGVANQSATDVYVRALAPDGRPVSEPVRITPGPAIRFGVAALVQPEAVWVAYRVAGDADNDARGDGGAIAVIKLGRDLRPMASPVYITDEDALPSGTPVLLPDGAGVAVFWAERRGEEVYTMRRTVEASGRVVQPAWKEPALRGDLPAFGHASAAVVALHGPHGEPGVAQLRCPSVVAVPQ